MVRGGKENIPKGLLDAANVVHLPVLLGDVLLSDRDAGPSDTHLGNTIDIILIEVDFLGTEVTFGPLSQTPGLHDLLGLVESDELTSDVAVEDGELAADLGALELTRRAAGECGDALGVRESVVEFAGCGAELIGGSHGSGVNGDLAGRRSGGLGGFGGLGLRVDGGLGEAARGVDAGGVLEILAVLGDQSVGEAGQRLAEVGDKLGAHQVLYGLLGVGIGVVLNLELWRVYRLVLCYLSPWQGEKRGRTTNSSSSVSWATSGILMVPLTSSSSLVLPMEASQLPVLKRK